MCHTLAWQMLSLSVFYCIFLYLLQYLLVLQDSKRYWPILTAQVLYLDLNSCPLCSKASVTHQATVEVLCKILSYKIEKAI